MPLSLGHGRHEAPQRVGVADASGLPSLGWNQRYGATQVAISVACVGDMPLAWAGLPLVAWAVLAAVGSGGGSLLASGVRCWASQVSADRSAGAVESTGHPMTEARCCTHCGAPLARREGEPAYRFGARSTCGLLCSRAQAGRYAGMPDDRRVRLTPRVEWPASVRFPDAERVEARAPLRVGRP